MYAAAGEIGYLRQGATEEDYDIIRGTERVGTISNPSVFYPVRSTGGFGDLTFIGATPAYVYRGGYTGDEYTDQYVQYGKEKLFVDYEIGYVANIGGKLVIGGSKDRMDFVFIEQ
jgi:hypothetical protein